MKTQWCQLYEGNKGIHWVIELTVKDGMGTSYPSFLLKVMWPFWASLYLCIIKQEQQQKIPLEASKLLGGIVHFSSWCGHSICGYSIANVHLLASSRIKEQRWEQKWWALSNKLFTVVPFLLLPCGHKNKEVGFFCFFFLINY